MASLKDTALDNRRIALQQGLQLQNSGNEIQNETGFNADAFSDASKDYSHQQDQAAADLKATPGYTAEEAAQVAPDYSQYQTSPDDLQKRGLTSQEQGQIMGDPKAGFQYFDPSATSGIQGKSTAQQNEATSALQKGMNDAASSGSDQADRALGTEGTSMVSAFGDEASGLKAAVDPAKLSLSSDFTGKYGMTPEQQQDMVTSAGVTAGNRYRSQQSDIARQAAAQGNTSPMAIAAMNEQLNRDSAADSGDAMTNARIAASNAAAQRLQTQEGMRLGAAQDVSTRQQNNATTLGNTQMQAIEHYGDSSVDNAQKQQQERMTAASTGGQAAIATADRTGQEGLATEQANQKTGQGLATAADTAASTRADDIATNRQKTAADQQNTQFSQGMATGQATAAGAGKVADARITGQGAYRGYVAGQQAQAQTGALTSKQQQETALSDTTGAYAAQNSGANNATDQAVKANAQPTAFDKAVGVAAGVAGAAMAADGDVETGAPRFLDTGAADFSGYDSSFSDPNSPTFKQMVSDGMGAGDNPTGAPAKPGFRQKFEQSMGRYGAAQPDSKQWSPVDTYKDLGKLGGSAIGALLRADGGAQTGTPAIVGEAGPEYIANIGQERERYGQGTMVSRPTKALMEKGDVVVPLNRTASTKVPASTLNMVPARYRDGACDPMAAGGVVTKGLPASLAGAAKARYRKPTGPAGPHAPLRMDEMLKPLPAYR